MSNTINYFYKTSQKRKRQKSPESTKLFEPQIIYLGGSIMKDNKYLEEFKIDLVKQYLQAL